MTRSGMKVVIAVDFGTTFSGLCWAIADSSKNQTLIQKWPGTSTEHDKVPTILLYLHGGHYIWGYEVTGTELTHEWFKLGIHGHSEKAGLATQYPSLTALPAVRGDGNDALVIDYLRTLKNHAEKSIEDTIGFNSFFYMPREYVFSVPAVWSDKSIERTRMCAERAGMGSRIGNQIQLVTEPEAAGIWALSNMPEADLHIGDTFVLCDAGGGTVDLISYTITALRPSPSLQEASVGSGSLCGSVFLNRIFSAFLKDRFKNFPQWDEDYHTGAMRMFENDIKRRFMGGGHERFLIPADGLSNPELGVMEGILELSGYEIKDIFEPVIQEILDLVIDQIRNTPRGSPVRAVLMAGGFGQSAYLQRRLQTAIPNDIAVLQVANAGTAIVRGALLRGLAEINPENANITIESRVARKSYGIIVFEPFRAGVHDESKKKYDSVRGYHVDVMHWFVKKGSSISKSNSTVKSPTLYWNGKTRDARPAELTISVYSNDQYTPPSHQDHNVFKLADLRADISKISVEEYKTRDSLEEEYYHIPHSVEMDIGSATISYNVFCGGVRVQLHSLFAQVN